MTVGRPRTSPRQRAPSPRRGRLGTQGGRAAFLGLGPTAWYDMRDLVATTDQTITNRVGTSTIQFGPTSGVDANDTVRLPHSGTNYCYLPSTASNNLSVPKDGGWAGTLHVTGTLTDDSTATFTTTASPILIGNTLIAAGRYKRFDVRDTDGNGTLRVTINLAVETLGQATWTCTTGQTVTVNRTASGLTTAIVTRPLAMFDGTDDYMQMSAGGDTPTFTKTTGAYTALVVYRKHITADTTDRLLSFESASSNGIRLAFDASDDIVTSCGDGSVVSATITTDVVDGDLSVAGFVADTGSLYAYTANGGLSAATALSGIATNPTFGTGRIGSRASSVANLFTGEIHAIVLFNGRGLTSTELDVAATYLLGSYT